MKDSPLDQARENWQESVREHAEAVASGDVEWATDARRVRDRYAREFEAARRATREESRS